MADGKILYACQGNLWFIKMVGEVRYTISAPFNDFLGRLFEGQPLEDVLIDLTETVGIDSTNLGLLAKVARMMMERFGRRPSIILSSADVRQWLSSMGFDDVFIILEQADTSPEALSEIPDLGHDDRARAMVILDAHRHLMELSAENKSTFKNVVDALARDIERMDESGAT